MKDCLENEINVGDRIVYPNRHGGNMWLCSGTVKSIGASSIKVTKNNGRAVTVSALKRVAVVKPVGEIHVVEGKFEAATPQSLAQAEPATKYPLSALGVPIKPGDRGIVMKWGWNDKGCWAQPLYRMMDLCNKPATLARTFGTHAVLFEENGYGENGYEENGFHMPASQFVHIGTKFDGNLTELTRHNKLAWITALRSGEYKQGGGALCRKGKHCCLGVACATANLKARVCDASSSLTEFLMKGEWKGGYLVGGTFGLSGNGMILDLLDRAENSVALSQLNDDGLTFDQIADIIEYFL